MSRLLHQAFLYDSPEHFAAVMAPAVLTGLERGEKVFVGARRDNADALRDALGSDGAEIELQDTTRWAPRPADRLFAVQTMLDSLEPGRQLLALGEPVWNGSEAVLREWARYESVINAVFADAPLRFVCLYDRSGLSERILSYGRSTHAELIDATGATCPCRHFVEPDAYVPALSVTAPVWPDPADVRDLPSDGNQRALRAAVEGYALEQGFASDRATELVLAVSEVSTNAILHGGAPITVRAWRTDTDVVCQVSDSGSGLVDPLAGWTRPAEGREGGWGLAISRRLCDALEIVPTETGTTVYLHMALEDRAPFAG